MEPEYFVKSFQGARSFPKPETAHAYAEAAAEFFGRYHLGSYNPSYPASIRDRPLSERDNPVMEGIREG